MKILDWAALDADAQAATLTRPVQSVAAQTRESVAALIEQVRGGGDAALRAISARFDGVAPEDFEVGEAEFAAAERAVSAELRIAMQQAAGRIDAYHRAGMAQPYAVETAPGVVCEKMIRPIGRVGL
ncbi:histidinol dehydrogenase, partial [Stenotrophomonas pictorum]